MRKLIIATCLAVITGTSQAVPRPIPRPNPYQVGYTNGYHHGKHEARDNTVKAVGITILAVGIGLTIYHLGRNSGITASQNGVGIRF